MRSKPQVLQVVAAALLDSAGRILIAQRPPGSHLAGGWEFPGGKLEAGESPLVGLARELREELGIELAAAPHRPLMRVRHLYEDRIVEIQSWAVRQYCPAPHGKEGQALRWCEVDELHEANLLPADGPIIKALHLPERLNGPASTRYRVCGVLPGAREARVVYGLLCSDEIDALRAVDAGAEFVVLSEPLGDADLADLCTRIAVPVYACGISLSQAWLLGATGLNEIAA